jgi:DNA-binding NtrC family response regulator
VLFLDRLESLSAPCQRQLLLLIQCIRRGDESVPGTMPGRLAAGSEWDLDGKARGRVIPDLLDCLDKIRIRVGKHRGGDGQTDEVGPDLSGLSAR